jgi:Domain of unknown function (DUF2020)
VRIAIVLGLAAGVLLAGCDTADQDSAAPAPTTAVASTTAPRPTTAPRTPRPAGPSVTPPPVTVDGPCPYVDAPTVMDIVGQHITRTTVTSTTPHPGCTFYRPNAEKAADVAVSVLPSVAAARARAVLLPGADANPVDSVGDAGAVAITDTGAVLAVSKGAAVVVVRINQPISLEAVEIAKLVVAKL